MAGRQARPGPPSPPVNPGKVRVGVQSGTNQQIATVDSEVLSREKVRKKGRKKRNEKRENKRKEQIVRVPSKKLRLSVYGS